MSSPHPVAANLLAFLLGVRGPVPEFTVDTAVLDYSVPATLRDPDELALLRAAFEHRPDLQGQGHLLRQAEAQLRLVRRQRVPDITLGINYNFGGYGGFSTNGASNLLTAGALKDVQAHVAKGVA